MSQPSMIDLMDENDVREALKQVVEDVERKRKKIAELLRIIYRQYEELGRYDEEVEEVINEYKKEG